MNTLLARHRNARLAKLIIAGLLALHVPVTFAQDQSVAQSAESKSDSKLYAAMEKVPAKARERQNPLATDRDAVAAGGKLFQMHCAECHGRKAEGTKRAPSLLKDQVQGATPGAIFWVLTNGVVRHGMPVWSKLPEPQRWQLITFLKSQAPANNSSH